MKKTEGFEKLYYKGKEVAMGQSNSNIATQTISGGGGVLSALGSGGADVSTMGSHFCVDCFPDKEHAEYIYNGRSLCKKHLKEELKLRLI